MTLLLALIFSFQAKAAPVPVAPAYVPVRVYDTHHQGFTDFERMLADLTKADVIFVGEQHDDPNTHRLEAAMLDGLERRGVSPTVSLEMFERDVQSMLDAYRAGKTSEDEFLKASRPWPRYATDYRPLVEMAREYGWPVVAANVPRRHASAVAKTGRTALDELSPADRENVARDLQCPTDAYFNRFADTMSSHPPPGHEKLSPEERHATTERYYASQCLKDETMAEAIVSAAGTAKGPVVHFNGAFHSDFGQGTAERVRRRLAGRRIAIVSILPVKDIDQAAPSAEDLRRADYLIYTVGK
jgi:uncharacterized iron-regulated protein